MIAEALTLLLQQLNAALAQSDGAGPGAPAQAVWGNVAQAERQEVAAELDNHLVLTLVGVEEERTLKNARAFDSTGPGDGVYRNPPLNLNLFLLFSANHRNYGTALRRLAQVLQFFQGKNRFTPANSPASLPPQAVPAEFTLAMDLMSPSFEEINHLWGFLGARQMPSALYRARLVTIVDTRILEGGGRVRSIDITHREAGPP